MTCRSQVLIQFFAGITLSVKVREWVVCSDETADITPASFPAIHQRFGRCYHFLINATGGVTLLSENKNKTIAWDPYWMICNAKSLQEVANNLAANMELDSKSKNYLFSGKYMSTPILMALATEIALKALQCQERKSSPMYTHDLLELFEGLSENTQNRLEKRLPSRLDPVSLHLGLQDLFPVGAGMRKVLEFHRNSFMHWRYKYERPGGSFYLPALDEALSVIINTYAQIQAESHSVSNNS